MICQSWKVMFHAEYSSGSPLRMLVDLRNVVDAALCPHQQEGRSSAAPPTRRPVAPKQPRPAPSLRLQLGRAEFEVTAAPEWDQDSSVSPDEPEGDEQV